MNATKVSARRKFKQMKKIKLKTSETSCTSFTRELLGQGSKNRLLEVSKKMSEPSFCSVHEFKRILLMDVCVCVCVGKNSVCHGGLSCHTRVS